MKKRRRINDFSLSPGFDFRIGMCFICFWLIVFLVFWICELILKNLELILVFLVFLVIVYFYLFLINLWEEVVRIKLQVYSWFIRVRAKFFEKKLKKSCYDQKIAQNKDKNHYGYVLQFISKFCVTNLFSVILLLFWFDKVFWSSWFFFHIC
jgi:hypothetical protein